MTPRMDRLERALDLFARRVNAPVGYALAVALVAAAVLIRAGLAPPGAGLPFITLFPAVLLACSVGGFGPAVLATVLSAAAGGYFFLPMHDAPALRVGDLGGIAAFVASVLLGCVPIELLRRERDRSRELLEQREALLRDKDLLLREIDHRVKNSLQVVASVLSLQGARITDVALRRQFKEATARVQVIALAYRALYRSEDVARADVGAYVHTLCEHLEAAYAGDPSGGVRCRIQTMTAFLPADRLVPFALLLNELVTNAFKHAYPPGQMGVIEVRLAAAHGGVRLEVADAGAGLPSAFDPAAGRGLGMRLITRLVDQLGGRLEIERRARGVRFAVTLPLTDDDGHCLVHPG